ncbi:hypothetical protein [Haloarchaeobius sp. HME9146]|uniref:hypothetical protein n=1 Tax=Haloarchaeobius sp. HME9146 TaxID=2978732 RepID=UPI0021BF4A1E|nr:hypothetical protein [Haloarchaeobius sp. HME9146]MCT9096962.1 hypothetical protein [Haloarchaeobius sp. HME9146]
MLVESLPEFFIVNLGVFGLIITGFLVEKHYVSRPAMFANGIALNVYVYEILFPPEWLLLYADLGLIVSGVAILSYATEAKLPEGYYNFIWYTYSSIIVGGVILFTLLG